MAAPTCLAPRHLVVALARRLEIPASDHVFEAALSFVDVDQVGDDSYERLSAHCEAVLKFVRILLEAFPIAPVETTVAPSVGLQALVAPFERIPVAPLLRRARQLRRGGGLPGPRDAALVQGAAAPQPAHAGDLGTDEPSRETMDTTRPREAPLP